MSTQIKIEHAVKKYDDVTVIPDLSVDIRPSEFFTLLGPSGCGKTTLLRMIAGFNSIEGGEMFFNQKNITSELPKDRNIGMVFQNYAIFPHLTVEKNVAFGLQNRKVKVSKDEVKRRVEEMLKVVQIEQFRDRLPENLSGGQQQRIALARAIVIEPSVLLMDEPLSNLDAKLRIDMRNAIRKIQKEVGITTVYVTHDQEEAMAVSDRIAIMNLGEIQQIGKPASIYHRPANLFVATFIGRSNVLERTVLRKGQHWQLLLTEAYAVEMRNLSLPKEENEQLIKISIRPEEFVITSDGQGIQATVIDSIFLGLNTHYTLKLSTGEEVEVTQESTIQGIIEVGTVVGVKVQAQKINLFDTKTEQSIMQGVENDA